MKKMWIIVLGFFLFSSVYALQAEQDNYDIALIPDFDQSIRVNLTIANATPGIYNMYTLTDVKLLPEDHFELSSGINSIEVTIQPTEQLEPLKSPVYSFVYFIRDTKTKENFQQSMSVRVLSVENAFIIGSGSNNPDSDKMTFYIDNKENIEIKGVEAKFSSIFFDFSEKFDMPANGKKEFSVSVNKEELKKIEAGSYLVKGIIQTDRGEKTIEGRIILGEKKGVETKDNEDGFFVKTRQISKINYGNVVEDVSLEVEKDIFSRLFTTFNVEPDLAIRDGFKVTYSWEKKLMPADSFDLRVRTNYFLPIIILVVIIFVIFVLKRYLQTKLEVSKSVVPIKTKSGHFALKVKLSVKARQSVQNVSLIDRIPGIVQVYEKFTSPTLQPSKIDSKNRRIQWDIGDMNSGEERVYSYMVYSTVGVVGKFALPPALAVFEKLGKIHEVDSNSVYFLAEQKAIDE